MPLRWSTAQARFSPFAQSRFRRESGPIGSSFWKTCRIPATWVQCFAEEHHELRAERRQRLWETDLSTLCAKLREWELPLCGAALRAESVDVKCVSLRRAAIAVGNEGRGLTDALLEKCDTKIILPMTPGSESLNAAVAASILMWEMWTQRG